ncbi:MAG: SGNH/GDSL hydrolase family protein [Rhodospirillales bacterium]
MALPALALLGLGVVLALPALAQTGQVSAVRPEPAAAAEEMFGGRECAVPRRIAAINGNLPRTTLKLRNDEPVKIVAIGSSSTEGVGASGGDQAYPQQLQRELSRRFPASVIRVVNKGVGGQLARDMVARMERDAIERRPSLVIWQTGVNDAERHVPGEVFAAEMTDGVGRLRAAEIDVLLIGPQYTPNIGPGIGAYPTYFRLFEMLRRDTDAARFHRFDIMRYWVESGRFTFPSMLADDRFHMNDRSYFCLAQVLADAIESAVRQ